MLILLIYISIFFIISPILGDSNNLNDADVPNIFVDKVDYIYSSGLAILITTGGVSIFNFFGLLNFLITKGFNLISLITFTGEVSVVQAIFEIHYSGC